MSDTENETVALTVGEKNLLVEKKATCPFIGSAVAQGKLAVRNSAKDPLASVEASEKWATPVAAISEMCWRCLQTAIKRSCGRVNGGDKLCQRAA